jgi:3-hydroxyacyl-[acyl-carrier-protein] dehydratase
MKTKEEILALLPYGKNFLFVDELTHLSEEKATGTYRFKPTEPFYKDHFKNDPVTPGVILTECMAQIGLVSLGIYLQILKNQETPPQKVAKIAFTEAQVNFTKTVLPGEQVRVEAQKIFWRMGKLKVSTEMQNEAGLKVCYGTLSGMLYN